MAIPSEIVSGIIGAGIALGADRIKFWLDRRRQRRSIATALRYELHWAANLCKHLREKWAPGGAGLPDPTALLQRFPDYVDLFKPDTTAALLQCLGQWTYLRAELTDPDAKKLEGAKNLSHKVSQSIAAADAALTKEGGKLS